MVDVNWGCSCVLVELMAVEGGVAKGGKSLVDTSSGILRVRDFCWFEVKEGRLSGGHDSSALGASSGRSIKVFIVMSRTRHILVLRCMFTMLPASHNVFIDGFVTCVRRPSKLVTVCCGVFSFAGKPISACRK